VSLQRGSLLRNWRLRDTPAAVTADPVRRAAAVKFSFVPTSMIAADRAGRICDGLHGATVNLSDHSGQSMVGIRWASR